MSDMSFDNSNNIKRLNLALLIFFTVLFLVFAVFMPLFGVVGLAVLPVPATLLILRGRIRDGIICAVIACLLLMFMDYVLVPVAIVLIIAISFIYRKSIDGDRNKLFTVGSIFLVFCGVLFLYVALVSAVNRTNFVGELFNSYNAYVDQMPDDKFLLGYASLFSIDRSQFDLILQQLQDVFRFIPYVMPGILIVLFTIVSVVNYMASSTVLRKYDVDIEPFLSFKKWDIPWYWCWGAILGLILILVPSTGRYFDRVIDIVGFNLIIIFGLLYLVLGVSVLWGIFERFKITLVWRVFFLITLSLFFGFAALILPFLGLIDIWVNFRRLKRG